MSAPDEAAPGMRRHPLALGFRVILGLVAAGFTLGGLVLIGEGLTRIGANAVAHLFHPGHAGGEGMTQAVIRATDELLFGAVLIIFAANLVFGFCLDTARIGTASIPAFMRAHSLHDLKATFGQVVLVYLVVDFATDVVARGGQHDWSLLVLPGAILMIGAALRLLAAEGGRHG